MATEKDKPKGYFEKMLAIDCETTGVAINSDDPSYDPNTGDTYQAISWGMIVADAQTFEPIEKLYLEIQWDGESVWDSRTENIHGLTREYLIQNGLTEEEAIVEIANLINRHWGPDVSIRTLGHNVATFDIWFLKRLARKFGLEFRFGNRHIDTSSIGFATFGTYTSDQLFEEVGLPVRGAHNALDDAQYALSAVKTVRMLFDKCLSGA